MLELPAWSHGVSCFSTVATLVRLSRLRPNSSGCVVVMVIHSPVRRMLGQAAGRCFHPEIAQVHQLEMLTAGGYLRMAGRFRRMWDLTNAGPAATLWQVSQHHIRLIRSAGKNCYPIGDELVLEARKDILKSHEDR